MFFVRTRRCSQSEKENCLCCSAAPGFVGRCLCDQCVNVAQVDENETCYEFLWQVHPLVSCLRTCTYYAAIFTIKQRWLQWRLYLFIIIYLLICMSNSRHGIVVTRMKNYSGTMRMSEVLVWTWIYFMGKGKEMRKANQLAVKQQSCSLSDLLKLIQSLGKRKRPC